MGGNSRKQTIGHRYYVGLHMVLCRQADALLEILMAAKEAWRGNLPGGRSTFNRPNLFGGDEREGGISGSFDLMLGGNAQPVNDYLASVLGPLASAYRGVVSLVMRRPYIGANTARLPTMKFKMLNIKGIHRGWYPEKAVIGEQVANNAGTVLYVAMDHSASMTPTQWNGVKAMTKTFLLSLFGSNVSVRVQPFGAVDDYGPIIFSTTNYPVFADYETFIADSIDTLDQNSTAGNADWGLAFNGADAYFNTAIANNTGANFASGALVDQSSALAGLNPESQVDAIRPIAVLLAHSPASAPSVTVAQGILAAVPGVEVFTYRIDSADTSQTALLDNTVTDGLPTISSSDNLALLALTSGSLVGWADMNPAHIIRCLWTDPMRGGIATDAEIGDSFTDAADLFYAERLGLSPRFNGTGSVEADRLDVERHADCISYRSRLTGKIEIKPIRNDYNPIDLPVLDSSIVLEWSGLEREIASETPNQLTVIYTKRENGDPASVTRTNIAGVRRSGRVIPAEPVEYPACTTEALATRLCLRDLSVQVRPLLSGQLTLSYFPPDLDIGEPFILNEPKLKIDNVVVRIVEVQEGNGRDNSVTVKITEDRYALPATDAVGPGSTPPGAEVQIAQLSPLRVVQEAPYYLAVLDQGQQAIDDALAAEPDLGLLLATGTKATLAHRDITVAIDDGAGYQDGGQAEFVSAVLTVSALTSAGNDTVVTVQSTSALVGVTANSLALIGDEIVRIDAMAASGPNVDITIGRGCLDTVPQAHPASSSLVFLQNADPRDTQYLTGETLLVKLLTNLTAQRLSLFEAPEDTVTFASRAIRPYPPGNLRINGSLDQDQFVADAVLTWSHRDRTLQTTPIPEDHTATSIGPEAGTTYQFRAEALDENDAILATVTDLNVGAVTTYDWDDTTVLPLGTNRVRFTVAAERDGYESWQRSAITKAILYSPGTLTATAGVGSVQLDWVDLNAGGMQEDDIRVYRALAPFTLTTLPAILATLAADTETYTDATVAPGNTYYYAVVMRRGALLAARFIDITI